MKVSPHVVISSDGSYLTLTVDNIPVRFHAVWLRDNARDPETVSSQNGQRLLTLLQQPEAISVAQATLSAADVLCVQFGENDRLYEYPLSWLMEHHYDRAPPQVAGWTATTVQCWGGDLQNNVPQIYFEKACADRASLGQWLLSIQRFGFATMIGLPKDPDALLQVTGLFGFVRETNYGKTFDVRVQANPTNLAYTGQGLQAHTDNPYRHPVPTMQILACVENTVDGGESIVVDGFNAAAILQHERPDYFALLSQNSARFRYQGTADTDLSSKAPMIELAPDGEVIAVRFNNRSAAPFTDIPFDKMSAYYAAYRYFSAIIERSENEVEFRLQPNELFIVDNTRVLHSRRAFSGSGNRWLRGCYPDKDGLLSTLAVIQGQQSSEGQLNGSR